MNKRFSATIVFGLIAGGAAMAQTTSTPSPSTPSPNMPTTTMPPTTMPTTSMPSASMPGAPVAGANSFTMTQAKKRMEDQGYAQVGELKKDDKSVWRGQAMKDGKSVNVALDYQGNVTMN